MNSVLVQGPLANYLNIVNSVGSCEICIAVPPLNGNHARLFRVELAGLK